MQVACGSEHTIVLNSEFIAWYDNNYYSSYMLVHA